MKTILPLIVLVLTSLLAVRAQEVKKVDQEWLDKNI